MGKVVKKKRHGDHNALLGRIVKKNGLVVAKGSWEKSSRKKALAVVRCSSEESSRIIA
jgi:hypothetical protein